MPAFRPESHLALAEWHLGELQRARERIQRAIENANRPGHSPTTAYANFTHVFVEAWPDPEALERASIALLKFAQVSGLSFFIASGEIFRRWAQCRFSPSDDRRSSLRQALASYIEQGSKLFAPRYYGFLAEAEVQTQDAESALALISWEIPRLCRGGSRSLTFPAVCALAGLCHENQSFD
jgi:predicted ATPase